MNSGKTSTAIVVTILAIIVVIAIVSIGGSPKVDNKVTSVGEEAVGTSTVLVSETTKVSNTLSEYQNAELGFALKYPSAWEREETNSGVNFVIPIDKNQVSTVATLQANVQVLSSVCAFPPITTIKDRNVLKSGDMTFNTISMSNTVQGREYYNRMYSLQKGGICYMFSFASISLSAASKKLTGSEAIQAANNNKAIISSTEVAFTDMVKAFAFKEGPAGKDETKASPTK